jgi:hypothetical protein
VKHQIKEAIQRFAYRWARTRGNPRRLEWYGSKTYSQSDEDGIVAEIFRRIGTTNKVFVEFGVEAGYENNTRLLLTRGWSGLWFEGNPSSLSDLRPLNDVCENHDDDSHPLLDGPV